MLYIVAMIDLNKIRSLSVLEETKAILTDFLNHDRQSLLAVYEANDDGEEDLEADYEAAQELLAKVERRMKSLGNHLLRATKNAQVETHVQKMEPAPSSP